ncbi:MAG: 16S rRNA (cytidine(1402)-2'-O)-methyltransferase [Betaproteobacteria bacterium TMED156]|nr:MAG: 16S rRNA (cytidine(1402)-2'-O)-methyltransferase [Betaproteobacteria bacterium TMED156]|tara:strand:- start:1934 stop:2824 length:891 start_codon:yes stop_codon:yes gene_type:complete
MKSKNEQYKNLKPGLYLISTPIGNLDDMSYRAVKILERLDLLFAEDTRKAKQIYSFFEIKFPKNGIHSLNQYNEKKVISKFLPQISHSSIVGYVSDAGTPSISDPGTFIVNEFRRSRFSITPIPGASALTTAISVCGFKFDQNNPVVFWGFAPIKKNSRLLFFNRIKSTSGVSLFFETPHRIDSLLQVCLSVLGRNCMIFVGRELTKKFETLWWGKIIEYINYRQEKSLSNSNSLSGEYVIAVETIINEKKNQNYEEIQNLVNLLKSHLKKSETAAIVSKFFKVSKNEIYNQISKK